PIYYVVVLREQGAAYYAASVPDAPGLGTWPAARPLGIDRRFAPSSLYGAVHQTVLGEIGFRVDSRIYGVRVARDPTLAPWCQQAHVAERGAALSPGTPLERGGRWSAAAAPAGASACVADPRQPSGLIHVLVGGRGRGVAGLTWRSSQAGAWYVTIDRRFCALVRRRGREFTTVARASRPRLRGREFVGLQVLDDGQEFGVYLDGQLQFGGRFPVDGANGTGVGIAGDGNRALADLEAHPLAVDLRHILSLGQPWIARGGSVVIDERFAAARDDLDGSPGPSGAAWRRELGAGRIGVALPGEARVDASVDRPNPGRTLYTIAWGGGRLADLELTVTAPGTARGQGHSGRGGVVFWQDPDNYLIVSTWLDDSPGHDGSSVSSFLRLRGDEVPRDAVWSNVGRAITWGVPYRLRVSCDGAQFCAWVDDRPVLYRALADVYPDVPPLRITRVGIAVNWEYGNDTGSTFHRFTARTEHRPQGEHHP
ncbi:MAG: nucleotide-binding protein, partial [Actinomycetota bacterium]|nr:nucleotide-binding protein [Actinomycetota bacterium]